MGGAIGEMLPLAIGIAISPLAIVAVILILDHAPRQDERAVVPAAAGCSASPWSAASRWS